jgi:hypothetical protein
MLVRAPNGSSSSQLSSQSFLFPSPSTLPTNLLFIEQTIAHHNRAPSLVQLLIIFIHYDKGPVEPGGAACPQAQVAVAVASHRVTPYHIAEHSISS